MPSVLDIARRLLHRYRVATRPDARLLNRLRVARAERDLSQDQLAQAASVSRQTISSIETGQYCPSALLAFRLARVLGVRVDELFWLEGETSWIA
jgi:putative transcriptional regulator